MKRRLTTLTMAVLTVFLSFALSGCGEKKTSTVYFLNHKPEYASVYEEIAKDYKEETGVELKIVTSQEDSYKETLKSEISKSDAPTIFQISGSADYDMWDDYCLNLKDTEINSLLKTADISIKDEDEINAIPYSVEGYGIIYNDAVMKKYFALSNKKSDLTDAAEIDSFEKLKTVVEDMTANRERLGIKGVFASTSLASGENSRWHTHLLNIPLYYEFSEMREDKGLLLDMLDADEITYKYSKHFSDIFDLYLNNSVTEKSLLESKSLADSRKEFALGEAAMMQDSSLAWSQISGVEGNTVQKENIKMLPIYTGIEGEKGQGICIGTESYLVINKKATKEQQKAAADFLKWLFSSDTGKKYVTEKLNILTPFSTFSENELPDDPLMKEVARYMNDDSVKNIPWTFGSFPSDAFKKEVGNALLAYAKGEKKWDEIKAIITDKWKYERD